MNLQPLAFVVLPLTLLASASQATQFEALQLGDLDSLSTLNLSAPPSFQGPLGEVRVLVFPHWGKFTVPQGRESSITSVTLHSSERCLVRPIDQPTAEPTSQTVMKFSVGAIGSGKSVQCLGRTRIDRGTGLRSYSYLGNFSVIPWTFSGQRGIAVINHIDFDEYVQGVIPYEMPVSFGLEALKAQAVAARTYAYYEIVQARTNQKRAQPWDLDDTVQYQAYGGVSDIKDQTREAVNATAGELMLFGEEVVKAYFHADSGGHLESPDQVWGGAALPYCPSKPEVYDLSHVPESPWTITLSGAEVTRRLRASGWTNTRLATTKVTVLSRNKSGRATRVRVHFGTLTMEMAATEFRYALRLRSTLMESPEGKGTLVFRGRGFGHGVGMNQYGARALTRDLGWSYDQVLRFYYEGARIEKME